MVERHSAKKASLLSCRMKKCSVIFLLTCRANVVCVSSVITISVSRYFVATFFKKSSDLSVFLEIWRFGIPLFDTEHVSGVSQ